MTVQGVPEGVAPPVVTPLTPRSLLLSWAEPERANGVIQRYLLLQTGAGLLHTHTDGPGNYTVTGNTHAALDLTDLTNRMLRMHLTHLISLSTFFYSFNLFLFPVLELFIISSLSSL